MFHFVRGGQDVFFNQKKIYSAPSDLEDVIENVFSNTAIIIYLPHELYPKDKEGFTLSGPIKNLELRDIINRNVIMIDENGNIKWMIENDDAGPNSYAYVTCKDNKFRAYRGDGFLYDLDIHTGKVSNPKFVK